MCCIGLDDVVYKKTSHFHPTRKNGVSGESSVIYKEGQYVYKELHLQCTNHWRDNVAFAKPAVLPLTFFLIILWQHTLWYSKEFLFTNMVTF